jgi:transcriptional regulator with XRE-family HTH domain
MKGQKPPTGSFTAKLNHLFATVRPPGEDREYTNSEVATATGLSGTYLGYLRKGLRDNPSIEAVQAIARFFAVRAGSLVDDDPEPDPDDQQSRLAQAMRNHGVQQLAMRAAEANLSPAALDAVTAMIEHVTRLERGEPPASEK